MKTAKRHYYTEDEILVVRLRYAAHHDIDPDEVLVDRVYEGSGPEVVGFRLAIRGVTGADERFGER